MDDSIEGNNPPSHHKFSPLEEECIDLIESIPDSDTDIEEEKKSHEHKLWTTFQNSALAISQLYKDNMDTHWNSFQIASTNLALLFKECADFQKKMNDVHFQNGYNKRNKELITWAKMKKNHIRRDELMAFISGRPYNPGHVTGIYKLNRSRTSSRSTARFFPVDSNSLDIRTTPNDETNLNTFREALVNGSFRNPSIFPSNNNNHKRSPPRHSSDELNEFINQEYYRHVESRKRSQNMDVCMDSPTNKRSRFA